MRATLPSLVIVALSLAGCREQPANQITEQDGAKLFLGFCARCHGENGGGGLPLFEGGPSPRNFHDTAFHREHTDEQLRQTIVNGKGAGMPPFGTVFDEMQLRALVGQLRKFDPAKAP